jgi:hypothetical protein
MENNNLEIIKWSAFEYEEKERNNDWFWALGIIILAGTITAIILKNYFFAILLLLSGIMLIFFAIKKPEEIFYEINNEGLKAKNKFYFFKDLKSFYIQTETESLKPILFIKTKRTIMPILSISFKNDLSQKIKEKMTQNNVLEEKMEEHFSEKVMDFLGF